MFRFACKKIDLQDIICCSFDLSRSEYLLFQYLLNINEENLPLKEIAKDMKKDRSSIQKAMKKLVEKKLVIRRQQNLEKGGYIFLYTIAHKDLIKKRLLFIIDKWCNAVKAEINKW